MKRFLTSLKRQDGFTLVELMVVVAIIGLLSAVAIPNFKKYQAKAKVTEAKLQLSSAWTAEQSFFVDYNMYHHCLNYMGFSPQTEKSSRYYTIGFNGTDAINTTAQQSAVNSGLNQAAGFCPAAFPGTPESLSNFTAGKGVGSAISTTSFLTAADKTGTQADTGTMTFRIGAAGVIDGASIVATNASYITINESKIISVQQQGY